MTDLITDLITDEMVEAARQADYLHDPERMECLNHDGSCCPAGHHDVGDERTHRVRTTIEAAAPLIAAKALRDASEALAALPSAAVGYGRHDSIGARKGRARQDERGVIGHWLTTRAERIEQGEP